MRVSRRRFFGLLGAAAAVASPVGRALAKMPEVAPDPAAVIGQWADYYHYSNINFMSPISPELLATQKIANGTMNAQLDMIRMPFRTRQGNRPELLATQKIANGTMNAQLDMIRMPFRTRQGNLVDEATV